jgi:hypothetical protein
VLVSPPLLLVIGIGIVAREERYLARKFGAACAAYAGKVRRSPTARDGQSGARKCGYWIIPAATVSKWAGSIRMKLPVDRSGW